jgi:EAL domain-containing protein (putative c-di-GMP-specific phosphodiesterase class I)
VETSAGKIVALEALVRWRHPERGLIAPVEVIPLAEETRLIIELGEWVLRHACREATGWKQSIDVTVNVSAAQFASRGLVQMVRDALAQSGLPPERLQLEITETVLMHDPEAANKVFGELRALGVRIALDDFGTGYSSLSYLRMFSFDKIKIDRSFVRELARNEESLAFIRTIVSLGATLRIPVCVEGVETQDQYDWVRALGCDEVQGFLISRPLPAGQIFNLIAHWLAQGRVVAKVSTRSLGHPHHGACTLNGDATEEADGARTALRGPALDDRKALEVPGRA